MTIKEKKVELIELFYDLIYVYAISRLTMLIEEPSGGVIGLSEFGHYFIASFVILQAWLYMTNYVNRYGKWRWYEYGIAAVNMVAAVYMSNTISNDWESMYTPFNIAMLVMLLCVAALYFIQTRVNKENSGAARNSLLILSLVCGIYAVICIAILFGAPGTAVMALDTAAVLVGAFIPFVIRGNFNAEIINFPHLVERFELLTIITFGEGVVGMTSFFDVTRFTIEPIIVFGILLSLYGSYVVQIHYLMEHHRTERALRLMFSHYFIVIAVNLITVALKLAGEAEISRLFLAVMMSAAVVIFYIAIMANRAYYKSEYTFNGKDTLKMAIVIAMGIAAMALFRNNTYAFLFSTLFISVSCFILLIIKYHKK